jgi:membrane protein
MRLLKFRQRARSESVEKTKEKTSPWKLGGLTVWQLFKRLWHEMEHDEVFTRSAALSYYFFSALIPMAFFLMAVLGMFASQSAHLRTTLLNYLGQVMPPAAFTLIEKTLSEISRSSSGLKLIFGLVLALWSGAGGMSSIIDALNRCYHITESRPYWKRMLVALGLTVAIAMLTICALVLVLYGGDIAQFIGRHIGLSTLVVEAWKIIQWPVALFFVIWSYALIYYWGPDAEQDWVWITPGSMVGVLTWIGSSLLFRVYLHFYNSYSKSYGSLGAVIVLLLWLYITGLAILVGGEINSEIENAAAKRGHPDAKEAGEKVA